MLALLAGCTGVHIGYRHADIFLAWKVNEYFDLDHAQEETVRPAIDSVLAWHRSSELPDYARLLETVQIKLKGRVTQADTRWLGDEIGNRLRTSVLQMVAEGAPVLATLTAEQIAELEQRLARDNDAFADKYIRGAIARQQKRRAKRFIDNAEYWVRNVSDEQAQKIQQVVAETLPHFALALEERKRVQREFVALLREKHSAAALGPKLNDWVANWEAGRSPEYARAYERSLEQRARMALAITDSMTSAQRAHAQAKLQTYIEDMRMLAAGVKKKTG